MQTFTPPNTSPSPTPSNGLPEVGLGHKLVGWVTNMTLFRIAFKKPSNRVTSVFNGVTSCFFIRVYKKSLFLCVCVLRNFNTYIKSNSFL